VKTVENVWNTLVALNKEKTIGAIKHFEPKVKQRRIFPDGTAAQRISGVM